MQLLKTVFRQEWKQFTRQLWMPVSLLLFMAIAILALFSGHQSVKARLVQIDSIHAAYQRDFQVTIKRFSDTSTPQSKAASRSAGMAVMVNYRLPQNAIKRPSLLSPLSTGLMDLLPWYEKISYTKDFKDDTVVPVSNPMVLFAGNFDYAFVLVYLLPLLIIGWCYAVFDSEKAAGTLTLLAVQSGNTRRVIRLKLLFRFTLLAITIAVLNCGAYALCADLNSPDWLLYAWWMLLSLLYLGFWFAVTRFLLVFRLSSVITVMLLVSNWLLLLLVIPSLVNAYLQARHPLPLKDELAAYRRHQSEQIWSSPTKVVADSFSFYNPQYNSTIDAAKDTLKLSDRYIAGYYDLLERRMIRAILPYNEQLEKRNMLTQRLLSWNPSVILQNDLNILADNSRTAYNTYGIQADSFQKRWQAFLYPYHFADKHLVPSQFTQFPVFTYQRQKLPYDKLSIDVAWMMGLILLMLAISARKEKMIRL